MSQGWSAPGAKIDRDSLQQWIYRLEPFSSEIEPWRDAVAGLYRV